MLAKVHSIRAKFNTAEDSCAFVCECVCDCARGETDGDGEAEMERQENGRTKKERGFTVAQNVYNLVGIMWSL